MTFTLDEPNWVALAKLADEERFALDPETKRDLIGNLGFMHPNLKSTLDRLLHLLIPNNGISIVVVCGVSGVGKSRLLRDILESALMQKKYARNDGVIYVEAPPEVDRGIAVKAFYTMTLLAGKEPIIAGKVVFINDKGRLRVDFGKGGPRANDLVIWCKKMLENRNFHVFVVDEVIHLLRHGEELKILDMLKGVSDEGCPKLVIVSDLTATKQARAHDQYVRRGRCVMLERYDISDNDEKKAAVIRRNFRAIMKKYTDVWPWRERPPLVKMSEEIRFQSLGDIGLVKQFLVPALELQNNNGGKWDDNFLRDQFLPKYQRSDLEREWKEAEQDLRKYAWGLEDAEEYVG